MNRFLLVLMVVFADVSASFGADDPSRAVPADGGKEKVPPQQRAPWEPKLETVPEKWFDAARSLFELGFADPRGCEYREIVIAAGNVWFGNGQPTNTHGWVLPPAAGEVQEHAVAWNGLVYPVVKVGAVADFRADIEAAIKEAGSPLGPGFSETGGMARENGGTLLPTSRLEIKVPLLLRLGEPKLAVEMLLAERGTNAAWARARKKPGDPGAAAREIDGKLDPFRRWAETWIWCLFNRAVCAHMRGDDALALGSLRQIEQVRGPLTEEVKRRFGVSAVEGPDWTHFLGWIDPTFTDLLAEQKRRSGMKRAPLDWGTLKALPAEQRISRLIEHLDDVHVEQHGQPGGLEPATGDAVVAALVAEGEVAVEPLLQAWEAGPRRLTRSVGFGRDFHYSRHVMSVDSAIFQALAAILKTSTDELAAGSGKGVRVTPPTVRAYLAKGKGLTQAERWFAQFAEDEAGRETWLLAAKEIVRPANQRYVGNGMTIGAVTKPGEKIAMAGESVREKKDPSLSELWARRAAQLTPEELSNSSFETRDACEFVVNFSKWDKAAAIPPARTLMQKCIAYASRRDYGANSGRRHWQLFLPRLAHIRAAGGDLTALNEYGEWLAAGGAGNGDLFDPKEWTAWHPRTNQVLFKPLWLYPEHPAVKAATKKLFGEVKSPMMPLLSDWKSLEALPAQLLGTPMCRNEEFQAHIVRALKDNAPASTMTVKADGERHLDGRGGMMFRAAPLGGAQVGVKVPFRVCDFCAWQLSRWKGFPEVELTWPEEKRDAAVKECLRVLRETPRVFDTQTPGKFAGDVREAIMGRREEEW